MRLHGVVLMYLFLFLENERKEGVFTQSEALMQEGCIRKHFTENENIFFLKGWQNKQNIFF
jgi:hypothetical protein